MGKLPLAYLLFLLAVAAQRVAELVHSKRNLASARGQAPTAAGEGGRAEGALGFAAMVAVHVLSILLPLLEVAWRGVRAPLALSIGAVLVFLAAQGLRYAAIRALGRSWNVRAEVTPGTTVVARGPYRYIRHPNYLAVCLEFLAIPVVGGAWISLVVLQLLHAPVLWRRIQAEERLLFALPGYAEAMAERGRLLPRWSRRAAARMEPS